MSVDEVLETGLRDKVRRWMPDEFASKLKLAHAPIFLSFQAKSRNPGGKSRVSPRDSSTPLRSAQNGRSWLPTCNSSADWSFNFHDQIARSSTRRVHLRAPV